MTSRNISTSTYLAFAAMVGACGTSARDAFPNGPGIGAEPAPAFGGASAVVGAVTGRVVAPSAQVAVPIAGALIYTTNTPPEPLPRENHCDTCVQLPPQADYTLSKPDGTFELPFHTIGDTYLVVQKGGFRRVRRLSLKQGPNSAPLEATRLPGASDPISGDTIPSMLVLKSNADQIWNALTKLGIQQFTLHTGNWRDVLADPKTLAKYQVLFIPCEAPHADASDPVVSKNLRDFVDAGGRVYITDDSYDYLTQTWPGYVTLVDASATIGTGWLDLEARPSTARDQGLDAWLGAQGAAVPFSTNNWSRIQRVDKVTTTNLDGEVIEVTPRVWVTSTGIGGALPATVSFPRACGKVMFSTYHTEDVGGADVLQTQDLVLFYVLLETAVCTASETGIVPR